MARAEESIEGTPLFSPPLKTAKMRKTYSVAILATLLVTAFWSPAQAQLNNEPYFIEPIVQGICCVRYIQNPLPLKILASYEQGGSRCSLPAIIFITKKGKQYCADPQAIWTQDRIRALDGN